MSPVVKFLQGSGQNSEGLNIRDVLKMPDTELESNHRYIQWLFPLVEESQQVFGLPTLTDDDIKTIRQSAQAQANLEAGKKRMLRFYEDNDHWLVFFDHNHLRITRILKSLVLLKRREGIRAAREFHAAILRRVRKTGTKINKESRRFWQSAIAG